MGEVSACLCAPIDFSVKSNLEGFVATTSCMKIGRWQQRNDGREKGTQYRANPVRRPFNRCGPFVEDRIVSQYDREGIGPGKGVDDHGTTARALRGLQAVSVSYTPLRFSVIRDRGLRFWSWHYTWVSSMTFHPGINGIVFRAPFTALSCCIYTLVCLTG